MDNSSVQMVMGLVVILLSMAVMGIGIYLLRRKRVTHPGGLVLILAGAFMIWVMGVVIAILGLVSEITG